MPVKCGHCKTPGVDVQHVRQCSDNPILAREGARVTTLTPEVQVVTPAVKTWSVIKRITNAEYVQAETDSPRLSNVPSAEAAGWYFRNDTYYRVKVGRGSKIAYGEKWTGSEWEYLGKFICTQLRVSDRLTAEQAKAWAEENGHNCIYCGRDLEDPRSKFAGYGEICAGKYGLPWGEVE